MTPEDVDLEYLYAYLVKRGVRPSEEDERRFIAEVGQLVSLQVGRAPARCQVLERLFGKT